MTLRSDRITCGKAAHGKPGSRPPRRRSPGSRRMFVQQLESRCLMAHDTLASLVEASAAQEYVWTPSQLAQTMDVHDVVAGPLGLTMSPRSQDRVQPEHVDDEAAEGQGKTPAANVIHVDGGSDEAAATHGQLDSETSDWIATAGARSVTTGASSGTLGADQPDEALMRLSNWNDFIPIGTVSLAAADVHDQSGPFYDDQILYFNWASRNAGTAAAGPFSVRAEVTGSGGRAFAWYGLRADPGQTIALASDQPVGPLGTGTHTIRIWTDYADDLEESDEWNNYYERTITVLPAGEPAARPLSLKPLGVSEGVFWAALDGTIDQHGGETTYAVPLRAGQLLDVSAQTPTAGGLRFSNATPVLVPADGTPATMAITVPADATIDDLDVLVAVEHRRVGDLRLVLVAPSGQEVPLALNRGGMGNHYQLTVFDDEAPVAISDPTQQAPFQGRHRPDSPLSALEGTRMSGTWQLRVTNTNSAGATPGTIRALSLAFNQALDVSLRIAGPGGELAANDDVLPGLLDAVIDSVTIPEDGTYEITVGNINRNVGGYRLELGVADGDVTREADVGRDLDSLRTAGRGNVVLLARGNEIGQQDVYTVTLAADETVTIAATTMGSVFAPALQVTGPGGFSASNFGGGPSTDSALAMAVPELGQYQIAVSYPADVLFRDGLDRGGYVLSLVTTDTQDNNTLAAARPISSFAYHDPRETTSLWYGIEGTQGLWYGGISTPDDLDVFGLGDQRAGQLVRFTAQRVPGSGLLPSLWLVNQNGQVIRQAQPQASHDAAPAGMELILPEDGPYYLIVTSADPTMADTGGYALFYSVFDTAEDAFEQNDTREQVAAAAVGERYSPNLGRVDGVRLLNALAMLEDGVDWFRFELPKTGGPGDYASIAFAHAHGNLDLALVDADGQVIRHSNSLSDNERVSLLGLPAGEYFVRIESVADARNPEYDLRIQTGAPEYRMLSAPFTVDPDYTLEYELNGRRLSVDEVLAAGENTLIVSVPSGGQRPYELQFDVTRISTSVELTRTEYDLLGNPSREVDALGQQTRFVHDGLERLVLVDGPENGDLSTFSYDGNDNLVEIHDTALGSDGTTGYEYDALNQLVAITLPEGLGTIRYGYDAGRVTSITYPDGTLVEYTYDGAGRLSQVTHGDEHTTYSYHADGLPHVVELPNGIRATYEFDEYGRLASQVYTQADGTLVVGHLYALDANGNRTEIRTERPDANSTDPGAVVVFVERFDYDSRQRLSRAEYADGMIETFTYDAAGNRQTQTVTHPEGGGTTTRHYHHSANNRLDRITDTSGRVLAEYFYDPRGNLAMEVTETESIRYEYDYRNLLTRVTNGTSIVEYVYDGSGDRVARIENGVRTRFVNDPTRQFTEVLLELDEQGRVQSRYVYGLGRISETLPGVQAPVYFLKDHVGSTTDLSDAAGAVVQSYGYSAFGELRFRGAQDGPRSSYSFTGEHVDPVIGLVYLRARYYNPRTGRFISKDPLEFEDGTNLYAYVGNNPVNVVDRSGTLGGAAIAIPGGMDPDDFFKRALKRESKRSAKELVKKLREATSGSADRLERAIHSAVRDVGRLDADSRREVRSAINDARSRLRGGVRLDKAAEFVGDLTNIEGATVDPLTGQIVLKGNGDAGGLVPEIHLAHLATALRAIYASAEDPGVTLDPQPGHENDVSYPQIVHLFGGLDDTEVGWILLEADRVMKVLAAGKDNVSGELVRSLVLGYRNMLQRWVDRGSDDLGSSRFWFVPSEVKLVRSADGRSFVFDRAAVQLKTEDLLLGNGATDPDALAFATWFTENYDAIAQEEFTVYDYPTDDVGGETASRLRIFERLEQVAKAVAFARFLYDNNIPIDLSWVADYPVPHRNTPRFAKTVQNTLDNGRFRITITGGVTMNAANYYVPGTAAGILSHEVLVSRPGVLAQQWPVPNQDGDEDSAVALSLNTTYLNQLQSRADVDLSYQSPGDSRLELVRYYGSSELEAGPFGFGWQAARFALDLSVPFLSSSRSPYTFLNGLQQGEVRVRDRAGQTLTFVSTLVTRRFPNGGFGYDGLNDSGVPDFVPGGSEQPDGSTLTQDPESRTYTLTRPDGSQVVFDDRGVLQRVTDTRGRSISYTHSQNLLTRIADSAGQTIDLTYEDSPFGPRVTQAVGISGEQVRYEYTERGDLQRAVRTRQDAEVVYTYVAGDDHGLSMVTTPDRVVESHSELDVLGRVTRRTDSRGNSFEIQQDPVRRITTTIDTISGSSTIEHTDPLGRPVRVTDQLGGTTLLAYDVVRVLEPDYDPVDNPRAWHWEARPGSNRQPSLIVSADPRRPVVYREFDARGNVVREEDIVRGGDANQDGIDDRPRLFEYDGSNNLVRATDARGLITTWTYNNYNQVTSMTRAAGTDLEVTSTRQYDEQGRLIRYIDESGVVREYGHDDLGNLTRETTAPGTPAESTVLHEYDAYSRRVRTIDAVGRLTVFEYNGRDQVVAVTLAGQHPLVSINSYDPTSGRLLVEQDFAGNQTVFTYNEVTGDVIQVEQGGDVARMEYDRFGNLRTLVDEAGNQTRYEYDVLQRRVAAQSLGSTVRVTAATGDSDSVRVAFSSPMDIAGTDLDLALVVRDPLGRQVAGAGGWSDDGSQLTWTPDATRLAPGEYSLTLHSGSQGAFVAVTGSPLDGEYYGSLPSGDGRVGGAFEYTWLIDDHANHARSATELALPANVPGRIDFGGDADWFRIDVVENSRFGFEVLLDTLGDSVLELYDADGATLLAVNDDVDPRTGQFGSRIEWQVPRTGTYLLAVRGFNTVVTGSYLLQVTPLADDHADIVQGSTVVAVPSVTDGHLELSTDLDTFQLEAVGGGTYRITTVLQGVDNALEDPVLTLLAPDGATVVAANDDFFTGNSAPYIFWTAPEDGTYFVQVASHRGLYDGQYRLAVSLDDHGDYSAASSVVRVNDGVAGELEVTFDSDWFSTELATGATYRMDVRPDGLADSVLQLIDASGNVLATNDDFADAGSTLFVTPHSAGVYYLRVSGKQGTGTYRLSVTELRDDHANDHAQATPLGVGAALHGELEQPGDGDWFRIDLVAGTPYRLETGLLSLVDSTLVLVGEDGATVLAENDDYRGLQSRIDWEVPATGTYYAVVSAPMDGLVGSYTLRLSELERDAPTGTLVNPVPGTTVTTDLGYVDIAWSDTGLGIDPTTIDATDVAVSGVNMRSVTDLGEGVWRYHYAGALREGLLEVTLRGLHVADLAGNWNQEATYLFSLNARRPQADIVDVAPDPRSDPVDQVEIVFSEPVQDVGLDDFRLVRDGGGNLLSSNQTLTTSDNVTFVLGNLSALTEAAGSYTLTLRATGSGIVDFQAGPLEQDALEGWNVVELGEIRGLRFHDLNGNRQHDENEPGLAGGVVYIDSNGNRRKDEGEPWSVTDDTGRYVITGVMPGSYVVAEEPLPGLVQSRPGPDWLEMPGAAGPLFLVGPASAGNDLAQLTTTNSAARVALPSGEVTYVGSAGFRAQSAEASALTNVRAFHSDPRFAGIDGHGYSVVVLDSGLEVSHDFFGPDADGDGIDDRVVYTWDFAGNDPDVTDHDGHGTHVTSILASQDAAYPGVAPGVNIIHLKVFDDLGNGDFGITERALKWVVDNAETYNILAVNMSLGDVDERNRSRNHATSQQLYGIQDELELLVRMGVIPVAAAGNSFYAHGGVPGVAYPAADPNALGVGAVWDANVGSVRWGDGARDVTTAPDRIASFSQRHETLTDIFAPGALITAAWPGNQVATRGGTSQATPHITGTVILVQQLAERELGRRLTLDELRDLFRTTSVIINDGDDEDDNVSNTGLNFPRVDIVAMGEAVLGMASPAPGSYLVHVESGETVGQVDFGSYSDLGWAVRDGQDGQGTPSPNDEYQAVTVDRWGNVIVAGSAFALGDSGNNRSDGDIVVASYSPTGHLNWRYQVGTPDDERDNSGDDDDRARDVVVDADGNVYFIGYFRNTVDFDPERQHPGDGDIRSSAASNDPVIGKLDSHGVYQWVRTIPGSTGIWDLGSRIALDNNGDLVVVARFGGSIDLEPNRTYDDKRDRISSRGGADILLMSLSADNELLWTRVVGGPYDDDASAVTVDRLGNITVAGNFRGTVDFDRTAVYEDNRDMVTVSGQSTAYNADVFVLTLEGDGTFTRVAAFGGDGWQNATGVVVTPTLDVYTTGLFQNQVDFDPGPGTRLVESIGGGFDVFVHRLGPDGQFRDVWTVGGTGDDRAAAMAMDPNGELLVAGSFHGTVDFDPSPDGNVEVSTDSKAGYLWRLGQHGELRGIRVFNGSGTDQLTDVTTDREGRVHATGHFSQTVAFPTGTGVAELTSAGGSDAFVVRLVETAPELMISDAQVAEGDSGQVALAFTVTLTAPAAMPVTVNVATADGTATSSNADYQPASGTLVFQPGDTRKTFTVLVQGDDRVEPDETFTVTLSAAAGAVIGDGQAIGTIVNDDRLSVTLDVDANGQVTALTDGLLILRYLFGFDGTSLTDSVLGDEANRSDPGEIVAYLDTARGSMLDVDGNGAPDALTDGLLILRYLFGFRDASLTDSLLGTGARRTDPGEIEVFLDQFMPGQSPAANAQSASAPRTVSTMATFSSGLGWQLDRDTTRPEGAATGAASLVVTPVVVGSPTAAGIRELPDAMAELNVGDRFHLEIWAQAEPGVQLSGGFVDIVYDTNMLDALSVTNNRFDLLTDGVIVDELGLIDDLGGVTLGSHSAGWLRLGSVELAATSAGATTIDLRPGKMPFAALALGGIDWREVDLDSVSLIIRDVVGASPWQNPLNHLDVTGDGLVAPNDVLSIANELNRGGTPELPDRLGAEPPYWDVNGDGRISNIDMLQVINSLNARSVVGRRVRISGEGEPALLDERRRAPAAELEDILAEIAGSVAEGWRTVWP